MTGRIGIIGGGPSALFMYKRLVDAAKDVTIDIFERSNTLGAGMPYSLAGANEEHITNVSGNEIPDIVCSVREWAEDLSDNTLRHYHISPGYFNDYKVFPRLFFGKYLSGQFDLLIKAAKLNRVVTKVHLDTEITDIIDLPEDEKIKVVTAAGDTHLFDHIIICTGHNWPTPQEGKVPSYFDSPYPPQKITLQTSYPVALRGSSLTAIDAVRTLARCNGSFVESSDGMLVYKLAEGSKNFRIDMHSLGGLLPAIRFHLEDTHLGSQSILSDEEIRQNMDENEGFLSLDYIFEKNFKEPFQSIDPGMYERIRHMKLEEFVDQMMDFRKAADAFPLFEAEYKEAERSIKKRESIHWKEMLAILSFTMNYPAKHFSAEDMLRLQKVLLPLISIVIAFVPQSSARELIALYNAGILQIIAVDRDSYVEPVETGGAIFHYTDELKTKHATKYQLYIDCVGQPHLGIDEFPFKSLVEDKTISRALIKFRSVKEGEAAYEKDPKKIEKTEIGDYYLKVPGIAINDHFQVLDKYGALNQRLYIMAVPYIGGFNPDYSGLDFCEAASEKIVEQLFSSRQYQ